MVVSVSTGFSNLVVAGEQIENFLKNGKIQGVATTSNGENKPYSDFPNKKEGETNIATIVKSKDEAYQVPYY